jgi:steroid 5-alpha reductase family enzyme
MNTVELFLYAWLGAALIMALLWAIQLKTENAGTVDVAWSFMTALVGSLLILFDNTPDSARQYIIIGLALIWGFRLGSHLYSRVMHEVEDSRYRFMRQASGKHAALAMFIFFQLQATWTLLFALPFWAAAQNTTAGLTVLDIVGILIWCIAIGGETISDRQLAQFRNNPANKGKVCQTGFWQYSRHPNYFFEWLHWLAYVFIGFYSGYWWLTLLGVVIMFVFITRITGIPYAEKQSLRSRGQAYVDYQKSTNAFFPWPRKARGV